MSGWGDAILKIAQSNPDVNVVGADVSDSQLPQPSQPTTKLEDQFLALWQMLGGPSLEQEYRFHPKRKWRADFCHVDSRTLIEIEGGVWSQGRHTRGAGYIADCRKYNAAVALGYRVFRLATGMITAQDIESIIDCIRIRTVIPDEK